MRQFEALMVNDGDRFYFQPCFSPVWDTAIAAYALAQAGAAPRDSMRRAADWLLSKEVRRKGDWSVKRPELEPSGWYFEFANEFNPDIDDSAMVMLGLAHADASDPTAQFACHKRAVDWMLSMQSKDGGWAAFDADNNWQFLSEVPFADHNAMLDPCCADITGRVLEALAAHDVDRSHPAVRRGVDYLLRTQEPDGSWYGRWGVAYIYGTCFALRGLRAAREDDREAPILRAGEWLRSIQNADGGWGESCASYDNGVFTPAASTPSQTAWAVLGLLAGRRHDQPKRPQRRRVSASDAASGRVLGRGRRYRDRLPQGFLFDVPSIPALISSSGPGGIREDPSGQHNGSLMRFPLSMTAGMAKYIFKNKFRPRPEWQKQVAPKV